MKRGACVVLAIYLSACPVLASEPTAEDLLAASNEQLAVQHYFLALALLGKAERRDAANMDVKLQIARIHSWQERYDEAEAELKNMQAADPANTEVQTVAAYLDFYRGRFDQAAAEFKNVLQVAPSDSDAVDGLKLAQNAAADAAGFAWQLDTGYERSDFVRKPQTPWNMEFVQLGRTLDNGNTTLHGRFEYSDEFETNDQYYEAGIDHRFTPWVNAYLYGGHTVDASFRPRWRVEPGGNLRVVEEKDSIPAAWVTLDVKEDDYGAVQIATVDPGLRLEHGDWALSPNLVAVKQWGVPPIFGWNLRLDGPVTDSLRFFVGYADAPETENAVTVYTASAYGGVAYDFNDAQTVNLAYTHDDRQNSWIRHAVDVAFTQRF